MQASVNLVIALDTNCSHLGATHPLTAVTPRSWAGRSGAVAHADAHVLVFHLVPETHLRAAREEARKEKEELQKVLLKHREEAKRSDEHYTAVIGRLELRVAETEGELSQRTARVKILESQNRELEHQCRSDRRHLTQAQAQIRSLAGWHGAMHTSTADTQYLC